MFKGHPFGKKAWRLYDLETNEFFISTDVVFFEDKFPGLKNTEYVTPPVMQDKSFDDWLLPTMQSRGSSTIPPVTEPSGNVSPLITTQPDTPTTPSSSQSLTNPVSPTTPHVTTISPTVSTPSSAVPSTLPTTYTDSEQTASSQSSGLPEILGRGHRSKQPSILLKNFVTHNATMDNPPHVPTSSDHSPPLFLLRNIRLFS